MTEVEQNQPAEATEDIEKIQALEAAEKPEETKEKQDSHEAGEAAPEGAEGEGTGNRFTDEMELKCNDNIAKMQEGFAKIGESKAALACALVCGGTIVLLYALFVIYLGVYGYANPDPAHCYYIDGVDTPATSREAAVDIATQRNITIKPGYPVDMAHLFRSWFLWGFWANIIGLLFHATFVPIFFLYEGSFTLKVITYQVFQVLHGCNGLIWFIMAFFWRFSSGGRIAAGEKLDRGVLDDAEWKKSLEDSKTANGY